MRYVLWLLLGTCMGFSQNITLQTIDSVPLNADRFWGIDSFNNTYYSRENTLFKITPQKEYRYKNILFADISSIDLTNPLTITILYKNNNSIVLLDNNLNEIRIINFDHLKDYKSVIHATTAASRQLWIFDATLQQLELLNYNNLTSINIGQPINEPVIDMRSDYNFCWVLTAKHIYQYNTYGTLLLKAPFENGERLILNGLGDPLLVKENNVYRMNKNSEPKLVSAIHNFFIIDIFVADDYLYIYDDNSFLRKYLYIKN